MTGRKDKEIEQLRQSLEREKAAVRALSEELDAVRKALDIPGSGSFSRYDLKKINSIVEKRAIEEALSECQGNVTASARKLGLSRQSLYTKMKLHGIQLDAKRGGGRNGSRS